MNSQPSRPPSIAVLDPFDFRSGQMPSAVTKETCYSSGSSLNHGGLARRACHQATIDLVCRMEHSGNEFAPALSYIQETAPSPAAVAGRLHPLLTKKFS